MSIVRVDLDDFHDFDVLDLGQPQIPQLDAFDSDVDENVEAQVEEYLESDSEDSDFNVDEHEESDEVSLDDESDDNEVVDDLDLELDTEQRMRLGHVDADGSQGHVVVTKMAKVFKQGRLWSRSRDGSVSLKEGDIFACKEDLLTVMKDYCVQQGITLRKIRNDRRRYTQKCANVECTWRIHASVLVNKRTWMIKRHSGKHICGRNEDNKSATSRWVASNLLSYYRANPNAAVENMEDFIMTKYGVKVPKHTIWRARKLMKIQVEGSHDEGYMKLPQYMEEFKARNPESLCLIQWIDQAPGRNPTFKRCQICIGAAIAAFKQHCRPLIGIDACHLKGITHLHL